MFANLFVSDRFFFGERERESKQGNIGVTTVGNTQASSYKGFYKNVETRARHRTGEGAHVPSL